MHAGKGFFSPEVSKTVMDSYQLIANKFGTVSETEGKKKLTIRETEVLQLMAEGYTFKQISEVLEKNRKLGRILE